MPLDPSIALNANAPSFSNTLGSFLDLGLKKQALVRQQATQQSDIAQRQAESSSAQSSATVNAANVNPLIQQQAAQTQQAQTQAQTSKWALQKDQAQKGIEIASGLANDPRVIQGDSSGSVDAILEAQNRMIDYGIPPNQAAVLTAPYIAIAGHHPEMLRQSLLNSLQGAQSAQSQAQTIQPSGPIVTNGLNTQQVNTNPLAANPGQSVPGTQSNPDTLTKDVSGNPAVISQPAGGPPTMSGIGRPGAANIPAPTRALQPGEQEQIPVLAQEVNNARQVALNAPILHTTNNGILHEIDNVSATGAAGPTLQKLNSVLGGVLQWKTEEQKASSYDLIGKYLERNALTAAQSMGPQTNAGLEAQVKANGSVTYNPTAIKQITKLNDALVTGSQSYNNGLQRAIANDPASGVLAKKDFDAQWGQYFKPEVMELNNAVQRGDSKGVTEIARRLGYSGPINQFAKSPQGQDIAQRAQALQNLSQFGRAQ